MTCGVHLRDVIEADLSIFFAHQLDPEATRMAAFPARGPKAHQRHWQTILADERVFAQTVLLDGVVAGNIVSWEQHGRRLVGYWFGREFWGKGVATAALAAFLGLDLARPLYAHVAKHNVGSVRVLKKCGFAMTGEDERAPAAGGEEVEAEVVVLVLR